VPLDVDMDGVYDYQDEDLFTVKNAKVNANGVEVDSDGYGVQDIRDLDKSAKNPLVNYQGKTINKANFNDVSGVTILPSLFFNTSSADIRQDDFKRLALAARIMRDNPKENYFDVGHADSRGTIKHNTDFAKRRAKSVINYLVEAFGIDANRLEVVSNGETNPIVLKQGFDASSEYENYHVEAY
tara:strand:+ start:643 stop:1194 length:552 start_codon:yes stop_codon:yes gene_type:complete